MNKKIVVSHPKSGRSWLRMFVRACITIGKCQVPPITFVHALAKAEEDIVVLIRDPRDVLVSYYFEIKHRSANYDKDLQERMIDVPISEFIKDRVYGMPHYIEWHKFLRERLGNYPYILFRYEELHNQRIVWDRFAKWTGADPGARLDECIEFCKFDNLKANLDKFNKRPDDIRMYQPTSDDPESHKFRKGKAGGYKDYLSKEDISYVNSWIGNMPEEWMRLHVTYPLIPLKSYISVNIPLFRHLTSFPSPQEEDPFPKADR